MPALGENRQEHMFRGSMVALVTPMGEGGGVDDKALADLLEFHIENGTDAIVSVGTTGESATLDEHEHCAVIRRTVDIVNGRIPVIAGTGANSTREAIDYLGDTDDVEFSPYVVDLEGRAVDFLTEQVELKEVLPSGRCVPPFWIPGGLQSPATIEIDSEGNVTLCPGLCIGNATEAKLTDIVTEYDYRNHPIISRIEESGPASLIELARHHGLAQIEKYLNECHVCYEMRRFLQPFYPEFLAPLGCYQGK